MNWVAWIVLLCVVLALLMLWNLARHNRARTERMTRDARHGHGHGNQNYSQGKTHAQSQASMSDSEHGEKRGLAYASESTERGVPVASGHRGTSHSHGANPVRELAGAVAGSLGHRAHAASGRWIDWLSGLSVLALISAALLVNKCDFAKKTAQAPVNGQAVAKAALDSQPAPAAAAKTEDKVELADASNEPPAEEPEKATEPQTEPAPEAAAEPAPEPAKTEPGVTQYYGVSSPTAIMAWAAEASMNPEYAEAAEAAPAAEAAAPEEPAPVAEIVHGVTQFYGFADKADADQLWSAAAAMNPDYAAAEPVAEAAAAAPEAPPAEIVHGVTQYYGLAEKADADQAWAAPATVFETAEAAPAAAPEPAVAAPVPGVTQYYGVADKADADQAWAAPATVYEAAAEPAAAPAPAVEAVAAPVPGVTQYYGTSSKADADQAWAAPATVYATAEPAKQQAVEACRDALNAEVKTGKLNFYTSSWEIDSDSWPTLDRIARTAKDCSAGFVIEVGGHTDNKGKPASNQTLSELRANAVVKYLTKAGVPDSKLKAVGYGQDKPLDDNGTAEGRRKNRRIEFTVSGG